MKRFLLDTCVVSDARSGADRGLTEWLASVDSEALYLSTITVGEIAWGIERLPAGRKRAVLERWLQDDVLSVFAGRVLGVDLDVAQTWGRVRADVERDGRTPDSIDTLVAAVALRHDLVVVTRNERDFVATKVSLFNPWSGSRAT